MVGLNGDARSQIERILQSETFQRSEGLRRLLTYLADKSLSEEADHLKEYAIGVDVFGKGQDYDTRLDSGVRIQVSRLRQKLAEYYAADGIQDQTVITLPKGQFKLLFEHRAAEAVIPRDDALVESAPIPSLAQTGEARWRRISLALGVVLVAAIAWGSVSSVALWRASRSFEPVSRWTPAMNAFWAPFVQGNRPLVMAVGAPLFVGLRGCCFYRHLDTNRWEDAVQDPRFKLVRKALNNPEMFAGRSYTTVGQAKSVMLLGALLGQRVAKIQFARNTDLSWQQLSESNALFIGGPGSFRQLISALPVQPELVMETGGLRVLHPKDGEPAFFPDPVVLENKPIPDDAQLHALISILPGPSGKGFVGSFSASLGAAEFAATPGSGEGFAASLGAGSLAAIEYATDPASVADFVGQIKKDKNGNLPSYFQVALSVRFKGGVPTGSRYLLSRELRFEPNITHQSVAQSK